ncbi:MAG: hypothetical protein IJR14_02550 [Synergistaceae bacterium]|nr:hypothetical protein [Synergistaceae bacterium]
MLPCIWYISKDARPWERSLIGDMALALRARGASVSLYVDGGTGDIPVEGVLSWRALTGVERMSRVLFSGRAVWHLWGEPPAWWRIIRLHARTAHTSFDEDPDWRGYPSCVFPRRPLDGEAQLVPTFAAKISQDDDGPTPPSIYVSETAPSALRKLLDVVDVPVVDLAQAHLAPGPALRGAFIPGHGPSEALRAAAMTMRGLVASAPRSPHMDAILGAEGYLSAPEDTEDAWRKTIEEALSERGRQQAASGRHHLNVHCSSDRCADSLIELYRDVAEGRSG